MSQLFEAEFDPAGGDPPLVSVIVPTYNRAALLQLAIASVLCQSAANLEVVVIDDGSRDATQGVVVEIAEKDKRVRYFRQKNKGVSAARNAGLAKARGQYIAFLDSDDAWRPWKLQLQLDVFRQCPGVGMVWTDMDAIDVAGRICCPSYLRSMYSAYDRLPERELFANVQTLAHPVEASQPIRTYWGHIYTQMLFGNLVHTSTVVLRSDWARRVGAFDESLRFGGEDYKFHLATTRLGQVAFLDVASIEYRIGGEDQITNSRNQIHFAAAFLGTLKEELTSHRREMNLSRQGVNRILASAHDWLATASLEAGNRTSAAVHALHAVALRRGMASNAWKTLVKSAMPRTAVDWVRHLKHREAVEATTPALAAKDSASSPRIESQASTTAV
jgi:glycosyltransferase involved in cell wall biosynthesis